MDPVISEIIGIGEADTFFMRVFKMECKQMIMFPSKSCFNNVIQIEKGNVIWYKDSSPDRRVAVFDRDFELMNCHRTLVTFVVS